MGSNGVRLQLGGRKQRILLGMLVCSPNEPVTSERLIDALWGAVPPPSAEKNLRVYIYHLRRILGSEKRITWRAPGYALTVRPGELDIHLFEDRAAAGTRALTHDSLAEGADLLHGALDLWRGPALAGLLDIEHLRAKAVRLEEHRLDVLEKRIATELTLGRHTDIVGELRALATEYPLRENLQGQLMGALYRSGRRAEALEVYRTVRRTLVEELGVEPGADLQHLHQSILLDDALACHAPPSNGVVDPDKFVLRQIRESLNLIARLLDRIDPPEPYGSSSP
ncbi:AfsR/SARP family transcriptional regulator [Nonomuraea sp. CA-141351]|uniref:AfsR/SARP family transcriptional regulator n=1 Tax=Nonomuraea sp. CA-141351 TaxID=3239996 RepID=UPI003D9475C6